MSLRTVLSDLTSAINAITAPLSALPPKVRLAAAAGLRRELQGCLAFVRAIEFASAVPRLEGTGAPVGPVAVATLHARLEAAADAEYNLTGDTVATTRLAWLRLTDGTIPAEHPVRAEILERFGEPGEVSI